ncbi:MAG: hypothetical protein L3J35_10155 [Bacteroidales bacterium]|nr:hypothetical protein [Bacteroidales bacterium]
MKRIILILTSVLFLFTVGCNITQEYTFNKDMSGTSNMEIDISALISFMGNMDSLENKNSLDSLDESFATVAEEYKKMGATNVEYGWKNNKTVLFISYDYKDIEMLNKLLSAETGDLLGSKILGDSTEKPKFILKGKYKLIYDAPEVSNDTLFNNKDMESMKDYYNYKLKFNFATEVKKLKSEKAELSSDKKSIEFSGSLFDIFSKDYTTDFKVKLKSK